jgi:hypothetical protein
MRDPIRKLAEAKRAGSTAQVVECLPSKCRTLNLNPRTIKKPNQTKQKTLKQKENKTKKASRSFTLLSLSHSRCWENRSAFPKKID